MQFSVGNQILVEFFLKNQYITVILKIIKTMYICYANETKATQMNFPLKFVNKYDSNFILL